VNTCLKLFPAGHGVDTFWFRGSFSLVYIGHLKNRKEKKCNITHGANCQLSKVHIVKQVSEDPRKKKMKETATSWERGCLLNGGEDLSPGRAPRAAAPRATPAAAAPASNSRPAAAARAAAARAASAAPGPHLLGAVVDEQVFQGQRVRKYVVPEK
jgi:hypothetical protein